MTVNQQTSSVQLHEAGDGVFWLSVADGESGNALTRPLIGELLQMLQAAREAQSLKVLVLKGLAGHFLQGGREAIDAASELKLFRAMATFPFPVIAAMQGNATGAGLMVAALCDLMVCSAEARHGFTSEAAVVVASAEEERLLAQRFGAMQAERLVLGTASTHWNCPVVPAGEVEGQAQKLAATLAAKSAQSLRLLKEHLARPFVTWSDALGEVPGAAQLVMRARPKKRSLAPACEWVSWQTDGAVQRVQIRPAEKPADVRQLVAELCTVLAHVSEDSAEARVIVVSSDHAQFIAGLDAGTALQLQQAVVDAALPVVAVLGSASGLAWLVAQACDQVVYQRDGRYSAAGLLQDAQVSNAACVLFTRRFGLQLGKELLLGGAEYSGEELRQRAGVALAGEFDVTQAWAWPVQAVRAWKQRRSLALREQIAAGDWPACESVDLSQEEDLVQSIPLNTQVIKATAHANGIVAVRMEDREQKNLFSPEFIAGMNEAFERIAQRSDTKVVILTGFDKYFASGGTREALLAIQEGKAKFTDDNTYLRAFSCPVPAIAAVQGHAVGGGLSLGLFADFVLLSEESQYVSPYMNYGFTPGAGATLIVPEKLGQDLGRHSLLTGQESSGSELKARGVALPVVPRKDIEQAAFELAQRLARHTREGLIAFKRRFNRGIEQRLAENTQQELAMHGQTFVGQESTLRQIESSFTAKAEEAAPVARTEVTSSGDTPAQITATLKTLLARELHMNEADIDEDTQFIDLGLDSITGVTWIRKVNERYNTSIAAIKVYSHPNLTRMSRFVHEQAAKASAPIASVAAAVASAVSAASQPVVETAPAHLEAAAADMRDLLPDVAATLKSMLALELHMKLEDVDENTPFIDLGLDSITGVTWTRKINEKYGTSIAAIKVYSYPTLNQLTAHVLSEIGKRAAPTAPKHQLVMPPAKQPAPAPVQAKASVQSPAASQPAAAVALKPRQKLASWRGQTPSRAADPQARSTQRIAVIGMAGRFPKAQTLRQYWDNIAGARNCISEVPADRWDMAAYYRDGEAGPGKTNSKWMGLLEDHDRFDPLFFDISPKEAMSMDPQQRVFLQSCWHAIEHAGYAPRSLSGTKCGVFAGCGPGDYQLLARELQVTALGFTGGDTSILAARVSYILNLQGPCLSIETACSSSLVAMATACDNLVAGNCDLALAGGVYITSGPDLHVKTAQAGMLSRSGQCYTFDQRADGFVPGEGVGVVLLKRLEDAERDGDIILGVIEGWGVNQDGKTNGITAPNPDAQTRLQRDVYDRFGIDPTGIQLIEAHGTGTKLGDPIEVEALKQAFSAYTQQAGYCALGSVKSNIGHCFTAAGAASMIKVLLALGHEQLPPTINFDKLNEHIELDRSPFFVNDRLRPWELKGADRRRAAISGFGFGGTNAHLVVGQYSPRPAKPATANGPCVVPLSARTHEQLRQKAADLLEFLRGDGARADLAAIAYTLQVGREAMEERAAFLAGSVADLVKALRAFADGETDAANCWQGQVSSNKEALSLLRQDAEVRESLVEKWIAQRKLSDLAKLWAKGLDIDWNRLHGANKPRRVQLPAYPFARDRYWIADIAQAKPGEAAGAVTVRLHPLLHRNTSNFSEQRYSSSFDSSDTLTAAACLEMARAAASDALRGQLVSGAVSYSDLAWGQMFIAVPGVDVVTSVFAADDSGVDFEIHSGPRGAEAVHCRGHLAFDDEAAGSLQQIPIRLLDNTLQGWPIGIHRLRIAASCPVDAVARVQHSAGALQDIDLFDAKGQVCVEIRGLAMHAVSIGDAPVAAPVLLPVTVQVPEPVVQQAAMPTRQDLQQELKVSLAKVLYLSAADIQLDKPFIELGLDSIVGVEWVGEINKQHGTSLTATKLYDYPNVLELAAFIEQDLKGRLPAVTEQPVQAPVQQPMLQPVAPAAARVTQNGLSLRELQQQLIASLAQVLYLQPADVKVDKPFIELGLDSIVGVEWVQEINKAYTLKLNATRIYDYTNVAELAAFIEGELRQREPEPVVAVEPVVQASAPAPQAPLNAAPAASAPPLLTRRDPLPKAASRRPATTASTPATGKIAIIGMSGRYPDAANLRQFWKNLEQGRNSIREVPPSRWDVNRYYDPDTSKEGKVYCKWLGMLDDIDCFDPLFFKISPAEAKAMDPQHRLFLEESYHAFEDAGYSSRTLGNRKCGVYLGIIGNEYARVVARNSGAAVDLTGNNYAIGAARVAYFLNLKGPAITIDTACSSSLVAIHLACQGLLNRETDMALAGGVTVYLEPEAYMGMCQAGMLSPDGQCKTFDDAANGFVPGEGAGAVVLKRLEDAERDGDFIYGVILGSGINQDGKTNGITAPSVNSQIALEREVYERCGVHPDTINYVEMHGTGTKLGDPIELEALSTVFREKTSRRHYCALGSVKSNVGHTSGAAGVAAVQKALLCMQHRMLVPTLNVKKENTLFDFANSPFYVSRETKAWNPEPGSLRRAGVSSFGFSGTNAHLVLEEYVPAVRAGATASSGRDADALILLSARTAEQVKRKAQDLVDFIRLGDNVKRVDLTDLAFTLMTGREIMDERLAVVAGSLSELADSLLAWLRGHADVRDLHRGRVERDGDGVALVSQRADVAASVKRAVANHDVAKLAELWVAGIDMNWDDLHAGVQARRVSLPTYPFARQRYWVEEKPGVSAGGEVQMARLHPLLHSNISVLGEHSYSASFSGQEFFVVPLVLRVEDRLPQKVLAPAACLEMARAAIENAMPDRADARLPTLRNVAWGRPLLALPNRQVNVALFWRGADQVDFEIYSLDREDSNADEIVHCQGQAVLGQPLALMTLDVQRLDAGMRSTLSRDAVGQILDQSGRPYARDLQAIEAIRQDGAQVLAQLRLPAPLAATLDDFVLHPGLVDGALQSVVGLHAGRALPTALASLHVASACTPAMWAWVRASASAAGANRLMLDIDLCDARGQLCARFQGVEYLLMPWADSKPVRELAPPVTVAPEPATVSRDSRSVALADPLSSSPAPKAAGKPPRITLG